MMRSLLALGLAAASCGQALGADAEEPAAVAVGSRVRITLATSAERTTGTVARMEPEALLLDRNNGGVPLRVALRDIRRIEVSEGRRSQPARGAMIGAAIGVMPGVLLTFGDISEDVHGDGPSPAAVAAMGAAGGALAGAAIGWAFKSEEWRAGEPPKAVVAPMPLRGGAAVTLHVRWGGARAPSAGRRARSSVSSSGGRVE